MQVAIGVMAGAFLVLAGFFTICGFVAVVGGFVTVPEQGWIFLILALFVGALGGGVLGTEP